MIGAVVDGRYRIESVLGVGGMGVVYRATHVVLDRSLAIKVLRAATARDPKVVERFTREARAATAIGSEHIIDITDFGVLPDGATYFVMELLEGATLTEIVRQEGRVLERARTLDIARQLCDALGAAHERGIVHRDLKPDNIHLIERNGSPDFVKVLDFGIAKVAGAASKLTRAGQVFGTPRYMSPEQCAGAAVDHRADIYALGIILYEMVSGRVPFHAESMGEILAKHMHEAPIPPSALPPPIDVSPELEAVIMRCLSKEPEARFQTLAEMRADLERAARGQPAVDVANAGQDRSRRRAELSPTAPMCVRPNGRARQLTRAPGSRASWPAFVALAALTMLASAGMGTWYALERRRSASHGGTGERRGSAPTAQHLPLSSTSLLDPGATTEPAAANAPSSLVAPSGDQPITLAGQSTTLHARGGGSTAAVVRRRAQGRQRPGPGPSPAVGASRAGRPQVAPGTTTPQGSRDDSIRVLAPEAADPWAQRNR